MGGTGSTTTGTATGTGSTATGTATGSTSVFPTGFPSTTEEQGSSYWLLGLIPLCLILCCCLLLLGLLAMLLGKKKKTKKPKKRVVSDSGSYIEEVEVVDVPTTQAQAAPLIAGQGAYGGRY